MNIVLPRPKTFAGPVYFGTVAASDPSFIPQMCLHLEQPSLPSSRCCLVSMLFPPASDYRRSLWPYPTTFLFTFLFLITGRGFDFRLLHSSVALLLSTLTLPLAFFYFYEVLPSFFAPSLHSISFSTRSPSDASTRGDLLVLLRLRFMVTIFLLSRVCPLPFLSAPVLARIPGWRWPRAGEENASSGFLSYFLFCLNSRAPSVSVLAMTPAPLTFCLFLFWRPSRGIFFFAERESLSESVHVLLHGSSVSRVGVFPSIFRRAGDGLFQGDPNPSRAAHLPFHCLLPCFSRGGRLDRLVLFLFGFFRLLTRTFPLLRITEPTHERTILSSSTNGPSARPPSCFSYPSLETSPWRPPTLHCAAGLFASFPYEELFTGSFQFLKFTSYHAYGLSFFPLFPRRNRPSLRIRSRALSARLVTLPDHSLHLLSLSTSFLQPIPKSVTPSRCMRESARLQPASFAGCAAEVGAPWYGHSPLRQFFRFFLDLNDGSRLVLSLAAAGRTPHTPSLNCSRPVSFFFRTGRLKPSRISSSSPPRVFFSQFLLLGFPGGPVRFDGACPTVRVDGCVRPCFSHAP